MILFINDIKLRLKKKINPTSLGDSIVTIDSKNVDYLPTESNTLYTNLTDKSIISLINILQTSERKDIECITVITAKPKSILNLLKNSYKYIEAAGGIVLKEDSTLLIHRLGVWDLPKGKMEKGETTEKCAIREVEEECSVQVKINRHVKNTYHSFVSRSGNNIIKCTYWYEMTCINDKNMSPQTEEDITDIQWIPNSEVKNHLASSYNSLKHLHTKYLAQKELTS